MILICPASLFVPVVLVAPDETVDELIRRGRALLESGKLAEAQTAFDAAAAQDRGSARTKVWVARGWIALGRYDDALLTADELKSAKAPAGDIDYLFGLAFLGMAKQAIASSGGGNFTQSQLEDSYAALQRALKADAERYRDAWLPLAEAAWYAQDLPTARAAGEKAVSIAPASAEACAMLGRIAFSQSIGAADAAHKDAHWQAAMKAFTKAVELLATPSEAARQSQLAEAHVQIGNLHGWKQDPAAVAASYAQAIGWDPGRVDFAQANALLSDGFLKCLLDGAARFKARHGERDARFATVAWWTGFAQFQAASWPDCEASFRTAVELWPAYANSWYYVFRAEFAQQQYAEAMRALQRYVDADSEGVAATLGSQWGVNSSAIDFLVGWCADGEQHAGRVQFDDAIFLTRLLTTVEPTVARHWNNLGLFLRDKGDDLRRREGRQADAALLSELWQSSYDAYAQCLELDPENPNSLNDIGVILHYYKKSEFERAQALYEKSLKNAEAALLRKDLSPRDRADIEIAKRDSADNLRRLKRYLERKAAGEDVDPNSVR